MASAVLPEQRECQEHDPDFEPVVAKGRTLALRGDENPGQLDCEHAPDDPVRSERIVCHVPVASISRMKTGIRARVATSTTGSIGV